MFPAVAYTKKWTDEQRRALGNCDPSLLEKCVYALTLLGHLTESRLPFLFKGGTSILLHLPEIRRLSIDIDIVSPVTNEELNSVVERIGQTAPFIRAEESIRGTSTGREPLPHRRHFRFWFRSERSRTGEDFVLLDVVQEAHWPHATVTLPIRTAFLTPDREIMVTLPTVESLLGDKLTAFAPTTTGVRLRRPGGDTGEIMQVAKQLFDVSVLFEHANDFAQVARVYDGVQAQESGYRENLHSRDATLADTFNACLGLTGERVKGAPAGVFPDTPLLSDGLGRLVGHLTRPKLNDNDRRIMAARAGLLAAYLRAGRPLDLAAIRYANTEAQNTALREVTLMGHTHAWLDRIKATAEAYYYWRMSLSL